MEADTARRSRFHKLHTAARTGNSNLLEVVLKEGSVDINSPGPDGRIALYQAVIGLHVHTVRTLLSHGASVNTTSFVSQYRDSTCGQLRACVETSLIAAARLGSNTLVELLLENGANADLQIHCHGNNIGCIVPDRTALHFATLKQDVDMVNTLLKYKSDINIRDGQNESALHLAARCKSCAKQSIILQHLCQNGAELDATNKLDNSALYLASFYGCNAKVEMLLAAGADVDQCSQQESSYGCALHVAAVKNRFELAGLLIARGARLSVQNAQGYTPLLANINAHSRSDVAQLLICHGANLQEVDQSNYTVLGSCIRNMRLDCEVLSHLLVYAGCNLLQEKWLSQLEQEGNAQDDSPALISIPSGRVERLCYWLRTMQHNPHTLADLSRIRIRDLLRSHLKGRSIAAFTNKLPLPTAMKNYILLKDVCSIRI